MTINTHNLVCDFGRHRGTLWTRVPVSYLFWMVNSVHTMADIAQAELDRRGAVQPTVGVTGHAIDRASQRLVRLWQDSRDATKDEGLHAWLTRLATEALDANQGARSDTDTRTLRHRGVLWVFEWGGRWPVLKTLMPDRRSMRGQH